MAKPAQYRCPECDSENVSGRYAAFWVPVGDTDEDEAQNFHDHQGSTELTEDRMCGDCDHEWDSDDRGGYEDWRKDYTGDLTVNDDGVWCDCGELIQAAYHIECGYEPERCESCSL